MLLSHWSIAPFCVDEAFSTLLGRGRPYCYPPSEGLGEVVCPNGCERPAFFYPDCQRMPRSFFFRADTGVCPYSWMKNAVFVLPICISDASQTHYKDTKKS